MPRERPSALADPWLLADEALDALDRVRKELHPGGAAVIDVDLVAERLRQLATGPED